MKHERLVSIVGDAVYEFDLRIGEITGSSKEN